MEVIHYNRLSIRARALRAYFKHKNKTKKFLPDISLERKRIQSMLSTSRFTDTRKIHTRYFDEKNLKAVLFTPLAQAKTKQKRPKKDNTVVLYFHGGGFCWGTVYTHSGVAAHIARASACPVLSVGYRLAPEHPYPAAIDDGHAAYKHLRKEGYRASDIILAGDSAGAGLAVALYYRLRDDERKNKGKTKGQKAEIPQKCICLYPWLNILDNDDDRYVRGKEDPVLNIQEIDILAGYYLEGAWKKNKAQRPKTNNIQKTEQLTEVAPGVHLPPLRAVKKPDKKLSFASPLYGDASGLGSFLIQTGTSDILHSDAVRFAALADRAGARVRLETYHKMMHGWHYIGKPLPEAKRALINIARFIHES